jgi:pilus assembly protein FimV
MRGGAGLLGWQEAPVLGDLKMPRLLVAALPLLAGLLPLSTWALGLGEITLRSGLNQPFRADILVTADSAEEFARLDVALAPRETFQRFGLDRPAFLGDISFAVEATGARDGVIRITSSRPVAEPFVTLLVEARWPAGRLLREYTVLLDPPAFVSDEARAPAALPAAPAEAIRRPAPAPAAPAMQPSVRVTPGATAESYQVQRGDTLWNVARDLGQDPSVSVNQMMVALFRANPEAFAGNINRLRAGAILRVPGADELRGLATAEANAEVARQNAAWRGAQGDRLQLLPPGELAPAGTGAGSGDSGALQSRVGQLESELTEARRLLSVRDDELRALQAQLSGQAPAPREEAVAALPPTDPFAGDDGVPADEPAAEPATAVAAEPAAAPEPARAVVSQPPPSGGSLLDTILGLLTSVWLWGAAAVVVALSLFLIRRRREEAALADDDETGRWSGPREPTLPPVAATAGAAAAGGFIVEERAPLAKPDAGELDQTQSAPVLRIPDETGSAEGAAVVAGDDAESTDVVAEADFHLAYGLYDQAADILNDAIAVQPERRDLRMKLLEVLFVWENKGAFLRAAQELHQMLDSSSDPDWARVVIMGRQICPEDELFNEAGAVCVGGDLDFALDSEESAGTVDFSIDETGIQPGLSDLDIGEPEAGLDFDFDPGEPAHDSSQAMTHVATAIDAGRTLETPTLEARFGGAAPTMESPTLQVPGGASPTMESPTIEARGTWPDEAGLDPTEAIDLDELGLDFSGLDEAADALSTGLHQALDEAAGSDAGTPAGGEPTGDAGVEFDFSEAFAAGDEEPGPAAELEPTEEMLDLADALGNQELNVLSSAMDRGARGSDNLGDTAEHPQPDRQVDDTAEQPRLAIDEAVDFDFDIGDAMEDGDFEPTASIMPGAGGLGSDGPTMTEVGTKLDLARAYIDMGDPDGARSILSEVLEEGDAAQRQEARQLLGELAD